MERLVSVLVAALVWAQEPSKPKPAAPPVEFVCPMDRDVRQLGPGTCRRCGMRLVANLGEPEEYQLDLATTPRAPRPGTTTMLEFRVRHPKTGQLIRDFELVHERIFHAFLISQDLVFFIHAHPDRTPDGGFKLPVVLPGPGLYRVIADFYPTNGTPQFIARTLIPAGARLDRPVALAADTSPQRGANLTVELVTEPKQPIAGQETLLFFRPNPASGLEPYLAAWGHMLIASADLIDLVHDHPLYVDGVPPPDFQKPHPSQIQFNVIFPRETTYRVWVQFQREGVLNTVGFNVAVKALR